ncbi:MAG: hypothetical protein IH623_07300 [Verrucomicrobia bacterium]|nr:hypothetical protein [Verrucomicrobiota bacterium]
MPSPLIRHLLSEAHANLLSAAAAARGLGLSLSRFHQLRTDYLRAGVRLWAIQNQLQVFELRREPRVFLIQSPAS